MKGDERKILERPVKSAYKSPRLVKYGAVANRTTGASGSTSDGGIGKKTSG
jgi:hypothetical protein